MLEAVYQQRITFRGEERDATGPLIHGSVDLEQVEGYAAAVRANSLKLSSGTVRGEARASKVNEGAQIIGVDLGSVEEK